MRKQFTPKQIEQAWKQYEEMQVLRALKNGRWEIVQVLSGGGIPHINGVKAEVSAIKDILTFPEFLKDERYYGG